MVTSSPFLSFLWSFLFFFLPVSLSLSLAFYPFVSLSRHSALRLSEERGKSHLEDGRQPPVTDLSLSRMATRMRERRNDEPTNSQVKEQVEKTNESTYEPTTELSNEFT